MKNYAFIFLFLTISFFINAESPEKVISQYFKAIGGLENWKKIEKIEIKAHIKTKSRLDILKHIYVQNGKGFRREVIVNQGAPSVIVFYDKKDWRASNSIDADLSKMDVSQKWIGTESDSVFIQQKETKRTLGGGGLGDLTDSTFLKNNRWRKFITHNLTEYKSEGAVLSSLGEFKNINGEQAFGIKMVKNSVENEFYFSTKTHYLLRFKTEQMEVNYTDYRNIQNVKFPFEMEERILDHRFEKGGKIVSLSSIHKIDEVILNPKFDESIFFKPKN
ncbi:MAG: hypothetical protein U5N85_15850 [Arcicella sp.]|nr:hypothetical protein [Arcicella sp.]